MFPKVALLLFISAAVTATPFESPRSTLAFATKINATGHGFAHIAEADRARAAVFKQTGKVLANGKRAVVSFPVTNGVVTYYANVGVGSPATTYSLLIDTGSSNTWVGAGKAYVKTSTSVSTGHAVSVTYGSGSFSGTEYTDTVTLASGLVITGQSIGVASRSSGFSGTDGILGVGPVRLTQGTIASTTSAPTVTDNLFSKGTITANVLGVFYAPTTVESTANGELTFGGVDTTKITSAVVYTAVTSTSPASAYWGINQSVNYGGTAVLASTAGIVDTGTTLILLATNAYTIYVKQTGAVLDSTTGLLRITAAQFAALKPLNFVIGGTTFALSANAQIFPRSLNTDIGGSASSIYLIVSDVSRVPVG